MIPKPIDNMMNDGRIRVALRYLPGSKSPEDNWFKLKDYHWARMLAECERKRPFMARDGGAPGEPTFRG